MKGPLFYAKILLFGEYGIIKDSKGLAIPFNAYRGALKTDETLNEVAKESNKNLMKLHDYLASLTSEIVTFNLDAFKSSFISLLSSMTLPLNTLLDAKCTWGKNTAIISLCI